MNDDEAEAAAEMQLRLEEMLGHKWNVPVLHYVLDERGQPAPATSLLQWAKGVEDREIVIVKQEWFDNVKVSTVFLPLDHSFGRGIPILWETMIFTNRADLHLFQRRCGGNREQAEAMHAEICAQVKAKLAAHG